MATNPKSPSVHDAHEVVDVVLAVAVLATLNVVKALLCKAAARCGQLEGPEEVGGLLEGRARCVDLVDQVLNADDVVLAQHLQIPQVRRVSPELLLFNGQDCS